MTPLFLGDLQKASEVHPLVLCFDTYERTGNFLDSWLRNLLEGRHGDAPLNILLIITGRDALDRNLWAPYEGLLTRLSLEPFTENEARDYLARRGITDEQVVEVILQLSGRLPLLVATLAAESPDDPNKVGDPSGDAVERFLQWVEDPKQRQVALDAALPRHLNRDALAVLVREEESDALFRWLKGMPFVEKRGKGWAYHDIVRAQMLRFKRQETPQGWDDLHDLLAGYYEKLQDGLGLDERKGRRVKEWQEHELEILYHGLCQSPPKHLSRALKPYRLTEEEDLAFSRRRAETVCDAGKDIGANDIQDWGQQRLAGLQAYEKGDHQAVVDMFTA
jgi:hypothetical protein